MFLIIFLDVNVLGTDFELVGALFSNSFDSASTCNIFEFARTVFLISFVCECARNRLRFPSTVFYHLCGCECTQNSINLFEMFFLILLIVHVLETDFEIPRTVFSNWFRWGMCS